MTNFKLIINLSQAHMTKYKAWFEMKWHMLTLNGTVYFDLMTLLDRNRT